MTTAVPYPSKDPYQAKPNSEGPLNADNITINKNGILTINGESYEMIWRKNNEDLLLKDVELAQLLKTALSSLEFSSDTTSLDGLAVTNMGFSGIASNDLSTDSINKGRAVFEKGLSISTKGGMSSTITPKKAKTQPPKILSPIASLLASIPPENDISEQIEASRSEAVRMLQGRLDSFEKQIIPSWQNGMLEYLEEVKSKLKTLLNSDRKPNSNADWETLLSEKIDETAKTAYASLNKVLQDHQEQIAEIKDLINEFPKDPKALEDIKVLHREIAKITIKINELEASLLAKFETSLSKKKDKSLKEELESLRESSLKAIHDNVDKMTPNTVKMAKALFPKTPKMIKLINAKITEKPSWWQTISISLPFHKGDFCMMTAAADLVKQESVPQDQKAILPVIPDFKMVTSKQKKEVLQPNKIPKFPHIANLWRVETNIGGRLFTFFRSGVCDSEERVRNLLHVEASQYLMTHREKIETFIDETGETKYKPITLTHTTISLLSMMGEEKKSWETEAKILEQLNDKTVDFDFFMHGKQVKIPVKIKPIAYNFAVAAGTPHFNKSKEFVQNCEAFAITKKRYEEHTKNLKEQIEKEKGPKKKIALEEQLIELEFLMKPIAAELDPSRILTIINNADSYFLPSRIILLTMLMDEQTHVHCKSGKDRTGLENTEVRKGIYDLAIRRRERLEIRAKGGTPESINEALQNYDKLPTTGPTLFAKKEIQKSKNARTIIALLGRDDEITQRNTNYTGLKGFASRIFTETWLRLDPAWWRWSFLREALAGNSGKKSIGG